MIKMLLIDVDGTLIKEDLTIPKENIRAIREASAKGVKVVLSTGRMFLSAKRYADELGLTDPIISSNGAYIASNNRDKIYYEQNMEPKDVLFVSEVVEPYGSFWNFWNHDTMFVEEIKEYVSKFEKMTESMSFAEIVNVKYINGDYTVKDLISEYGKQIQKGIVFLAKNEVEEVTKKLLLNDNLSVVSSTDSNIEVTHKKADKGIAALKLAKALNIKKEEIMCLGDSGNDLSMFKAVGFPVAMENAVDSLKEVAKATTDTNENHGVAKAIDKFILGKK